MAEFPYADPYCCLRDMGSVKSPSCVIQQGKQEIMGKGDFLRGKSVSCAGKSLMEIMEDELDVAMDWLMDEEPHCLDGYLTENWKGRAQALAWCIALVLQPYEPNIDGVKGSAVVRYRIRKAERDLEALEAKETAEEEGADESSVGRENFAYFD